MLLLFKANRVIFLTQIQMFCQTPFWALSKNKGFKAIIFKFSFVVVVVVVVLSHDLFAVGTLLYDKTFLATNRYRHAQITRRISDIQQQQNITTTQQTETKKEENFYFCFETFFWYGLFNTKQRNNSKAERTLMLLLHFFVFLDFLPHIGCCCFHTISPQKWAAATCPMF